MMAERQRLRKIRRPLICTLMCDILTRAERQSSLRVSSRPRSLSRSVFAHLSVSIHFTPSPFLFCVRSPSLSYSVSLKRLFSLLHSHWSHGSLHISLLVNTWGWDQYLINK